ncbi:hypothetical protein MMC10_009108 [Thelotrema lepadinum]|nr:hypothetical protein [Thelotrema lepadinum]
MHTTVQAVEPLYPGTALGPLIWVYTDLFLALAPAPMIFKLNLSLPKRIRVYLLLTLGQTATICAIFKEVDINTLFTSVDFTWDTFSLYAWTISEVFVIILCSSFASIKTLFDQKLKGRLQSFKSTYGDTHDSVRKFRSGHAARCSVSADGEYHRMSAVSTQESGVNIGSGDGRGDLVTTGTKSGYPRITA